MMPFFRAVCLHNSVIIVIFARINRYNMSEKIRIKDIAERAGVSVGTVDRVLHSRPNVSPSAKAKVDAVLKSWTTKPMSMPVPWRATAPIVLSCSCQSMSPRLIGKKLSWEP